MYIYEGNRKIALDKTVPENCIWLLFPYQMSETQQAKQQRLCGSFVLLETHTAIHFSFKGLESKYLRLGELHGLCFHYSTQLL